MKRLPSQDAVINLMNGEPGGLPEVLISTAARAVIISAGVYASGVRGVQVAKTSILSALAIEAFVIAFTVLGGDDDDK